MDLAMVKTTMDSREIADYTGKAHSDVCRDIRKMLEGLEVGESNFASSYISEQNKAVTCYKLPKRECLILVSGYSVQLRAKIIDRWAELESGMPNFNNPLEAAKAWVFAEEGRLLAERRSFALERRIEDQKPAVEFVADLVDTTSLTTISDAAKEFGYGPKEFAGMLGARKIIFKRTKGGPWLAKQEHLDAGRFSTKIHMVGRDWAKPTTCLTGKGLVWLRSVLTPVPKTFDGLFGEM